MKKKSVTPKLQKEVRAACQKMMNFYANCDMTDFPEYIHICQQIAAMEGEKE